MPNEALLVPVLPPRRCRRANDCTRTPPPPYGGARSLSLGPQHVDWIWLTFLCLLCVGSARADLAPEDKRAIEGAVREHAEIPRRTPGGQGGVDYHFHGGRIVEIEAGRVRVEGATLEMRVHYGASRDYEYQDLCDFVLTKGSNGWEIVETNADEKIDGMIAAADEEFEAEWRPWKHYLVHFLVFIGLMAGSIVLVFRKARGKQRTVLAVLLLALLAAGVFLYAVCGVVVACAV